MDKKIIEIAKRYAEKARREMPAEMVILYGSYVNGRARPTSDIDIAVVVDKVPGDYLQASTILFNLVRDVDKRIEPVLVVRRNDRSGFFDSVLKHGSVIYKSRH